MKSLPIPYVWDAELSGVLSNSNVLHSMVLGMNTGILGRLGRKLNAATVVDSL